MYLTNSDFQAHGQRLPTLQGGNRPVHYQQQHQQQQQQQHQQHQQQQQQQQQQQHQQRQQHHQHVNDDVAAFSEAAMFRRIEMVRRADEQRQKQQQQFQYQQQQHQQHQRQQSMCNNNQSNDLNFVTKARKQAFNAAAAAAAAAIAARQQPPAPCDVSKTFGSGGSAFAAAARKFVTPSENNHGDNNKNNDTGRTVQQSLTSAMQQRMAAAANAASAAIPEVGFTRSVNKNFGSTTQQQLGGGGFMGKETGEKLQLPNNNESANLANLQSKSDTTKKECENGDLLTLHQMERDRVDQMMNTLLQLRKRQDDEIERLKEAEKEEKRKKEEQEKREKLEREEARRQESNNRPVTQWRICKHCQSKAFASAVDAEEHEAICPLNAERSAKANSVVKTSQASPTGLSKISGLIESSNNHTPSVSKSLPSPDQVKHISILPNNIKNKISVQLEDGDDKNDNFFTIDPTQQTTISIPLGTSKDQTIGMSPFHVFVRRHCVQVFAPTARNTKNKRATAERANMSGLVGIRCPYCHVDSKNSTVLPGNVVFPSSVRDIYPSTDRLLVQHVVHCPSVPVAVAKCFRELRAKPNAHQSNHQQAGMTREDVWTMAARRLGLTDDPKGGVRFMMKKTPSAPKSVQGVPTKSLPWSMMSSSMSSTKALPTSISSSMLLKSFPKFANMNNPSEFLKKALRFQGYPSSGGTMPPPEKSLFDLNDKGIDNSRQKSGKQHSAGPSSAPSGNAAAVIADDDGSKSKLVDLATSFKQNLAGTSTNQPATASVVSSDSSDDSEQDENTQNTQHPPPSSESLVLPSDSTKATAFSFYLLGQMRRCYFTESDRIGKRPKSLPVGFAGLACRHCYDQYGSARFFPSMLKTLSDTSKTLNVLHKHMMNCRYCPKEVRDELDRLRLSHNDERAKMKFGSQKAFFAKIWQRLHERSGDVQKHGNDTKPETPSDKVGDRGAGKSRPADKAEDGTTTNKNNDTKKASTKTSDGFAALSEAAALHMAVLEKASTQETESKDTKKEDSAPEPNLKRSFSSLGGNNGDVNSYPNDRRDSDSAKRAKAA